MSEKLIRKTFGSETKEVDGERALNVTITTRDKDRDGDIVEPQGVKLTNFRKNPVVLLAHDYRGLPIAKAEKLEKTEESIKAKVVFPDEGTYPIADTVYNLYKNKFMKAWSIGFIPLKIEDIDADDEEGKETRSGGRRFKSIELLEFSACSVPANPHALSNMIDKGIDLEPLREAGIIEIEEGKEVVDKPEETETHIHIPIRDKNDFFQESFRTITIGKENEGIKAVIGKLKSDPNGPTKVQKYIFDKSKGWTMEKAKKWVEEHGKSADLECHEDENVKKSYNAEEIYEIVKENKELKEKLKELELKSGAVLNTKNKGNLKQAQQLIQEVLDSAEPAEEDSQENDEDNEKEIEVIEEDDSIKDGDVKDEVTDEEEIEVDDEVISEVINEKMDYLLGRVKQSNAKNNKKGSEKS